MPLSKAKMRERKRQARVKPNSIPDVKPNKAGGDMSLRVRPEREAESKSTLIVNRQGTSQPTPIEREEAKPVVSKPESRGPEPKAPFINTTATAYVPFYNPDLHHAGDLVKHWVGDKLVEFVVPEIDLDGKPLETGSIGRLIVDKPNLSHKFKRFGKDEQIKRGKK